MQYVLIFQKIEYLFLQINVDQQFYLDLGKDYFAWMVLSQF